MTAAVAEPDMDRPPGWKDTLSLWLSGLVAFGVLVGVLAGAHWLSAGGPLYWLGFGPPVRIVKLAPYDRSALVEQINERLDQRADPESETNGREDDEHLSALRRRLEERAARMVPEWRENGIGCDIFLSNWSGSRVRFRLRTVWRDNEGYIYGGHDLYNEFGNTEFEIPAWEKAREMIVGECPDKIELVVLGDE